MKRSASPLRKFLEMVGNLLLAIVLALFVWIVAERAANPDIERVLSAAIPITLQNVPAGMLTYEPSARMVRVTLSAPASTWGVLTADRLAASIDLSGQMSGTLDLPVQVTVDDRTARVTKIDPPRVSLQMEPLAETQLPVTVNVNGDPALGFVAHALTTTPATVTVRGPLSFVQQLAAVSGQLSIQDARATISQTVNLFPRDRSGQTVPYVTLIPSSTQAVVPLQPLGGFRDLAVKIDLRGNVAPGYLITNVSVDPQVVTVFGSSSALDASPGFISTEPVSVTEAVNDINDRVRLALPPGVSFLGDPTVQVDIKIKPIESSVTLMSPLNPQGLSSDLSAHFSPETLDVILSGPIARLTPLQSSGVESFVNLFGLGEGTYQITPTVVIPSGINIVSVLPSTIQVTIGPYVTPTITATTTLSLPLATTPKP